MSTCATTRGTDFLSDFCGILGDKVRISRKDVLTDGTAVQIATVNKKYDKFCGKPQT